ncbi:MAG TPA: UDPGP type 1 family protein [Pirellulales bacterium]
MSELFQATIVPTSFDELTQQLTPFGQQHLLRFWGELDEAGRQRLAAQLRRIDFPSLALLGRAASAGDDWSALALCAVPPQAVRLNAAANKVSEAQARAAGEQALRNGEVGAILVAGGQGTRLGFDHPKGMYQIGPVSKASLFQILFERLLAVGRRYGASIPLYLMTSDATNDPTQTYLHEQSHFGLPTDDVRLFCQGVMPAVDAASGQVLLAGKGELALSPDGHGGMLAALARTGNLADMQTRGLKHLFYFQVDNPLAPVCDPVFLGHHILARSELSTLAVAKREALERVGNIVEIDGRTRIIEYSDLPEAAAKQCNVDGSLRLWAGNTAIHVFDFEFLRRTSGDQAALPFHIAKKKVPFINEQGQTIEPTSPNAVKYERFIFDLLPLANRALVVEADAAESFAPVKNAPGEQKDSPETCQRAMMALHRQWLAHAGAKIAADVTVEISPLFALDAEEIATKVKPGTAIAAATYLR